MCSNSRRDFLKLSLMGAASACSAAGLGPLGMSSAHAQSSGGRGRTLVFFNLFGGNDHLNSFAVPYTVNAYYDRRSTIAIPANNVLALRRGIGLNPILDRLHSLYNDGDVAIIQGTGDPIANRSHFTSQDYMARGIIDRAAARDNRGWIGRLGDLYFDEPFNTFGLDVGANLTLAGTRAQNRPINASRLQNVGFDDDRSGGNENRQRRELQEVLLTRMAADTARKSSAVAAQKAMYDAVQVIQGVRNDFSTSASFNTGTREGRYFQEAAQLISSSRVATQVTYSGVGGFDTHSNQVGGHESRLQRIDDAIWAFAQDMKAKGKWNDVAICLFTEFGRINFENGSNGTDHAKASVMILVGGGVNGGVYGPTPTDSELRNDRFIDVAVDFRNVYSELITWLGYDAGPVFPESFSRVNLGAI